MTGNGYLVITRKQEERYYLIVTKPLCPGEIIEIIQGRIYKNIGGISSKHYIKAPKSLRILREEHILKEGGLEVVTEKAKQGKLE